MPLIIVILFSACQRVNSDPSPIVQITAPATPTTVPSSTPTTPPTITPTKTSSPTITPTPLPTATPTATAVPITISGNPRAAIIGTPAVNGIAPCGVVDLLDFPLDPPHGDNARGGGDFGMWRNRYEKYHAGEDWRLASGTNLGEPVYSVGHGLVTYADPNGWGRDKGVVIVRHTFGNGDSVLSFYGHLDPPSVVTQPGLCVTRGEQVGSIGKPRTSPHLHFEMRTHLPYQTATGYWFEDPRLEGWLPPSQTIWHSRLESSPGVNWTHMAANGGIMFIGITAQQTLVTIEENQVQGMDSSDGRLLWSFSLPEDSETAVLDAKQNILYSASQRGTIKAFRLPETENGENPSTNPVELEPIWSQDFDLVGIPLLLPLPGGGLVLFVWDQMLAISAQGMLLWTQDNINRPIYWIPYADNLLVSSTANGGSIMSLSADSAMPWEVSSGGKISIQNGQISLLTIEGIYRLDPSQMSAQLLLDLPGRRIDLANIITLPNGDTLFTHLDNFDRRLILIDNQGELLWQRSIRNEITGKTSFIALEGQVFLIEEKAIGDSLAIVIYAVDQARGDLLQIFEGGTRTRISESLDLMILDNDQIAINIGGQNITVVDLNSSIAIIRQ